MIFNFYTYSNCKTVKEMFEEDGLTETNVEIFKKNECISFVDLKLENLNDNYKNAYFIFGKSNDDDETTLDLDDVYCFVGDKGPFDNFIIEDEYDLKIKAGTSYKKGDYSYLSVLPETMIEYFKEKEALTDLSRQDDLILKYFRPYVKQISATKFDLYNGVGFFTLTKDGKKFKSPLLKFKKDENYILFYTIIAPAPIIAPFLSTGVIITMAVISGVILISIAVGVFIYLDKRAKRNFENKNEVEASYTINIT